MVSTHAAIIKHTFTKHYTQFTIFIGEILFSLFWMESFIFRRIEKFCPCVGFSIYL